MKMRIVLFRFFMMAALMGVPAVAQDREIKKIDNAAKHQGEEQVLDRLSSQLGMPATTLRQQKQQHKLSYGELFVANALATASSKSFETIISEFRSGKGWGMIAQENNVRLGEIVSHARRTEQELLKGDEHGKAGRKTERKEMQGHQKQEREEMKTHQKQERDALKTHQKGEREMMKQQDPMPRREPSSPPDRGRGKGKRY